MSRDWFSEPGCTRSMMGLRLNSNGLHLWLVSSSHDRSETAVAMFIVLVLKISPSFFVFADVCSSSYNASYIRTKSDTQQDEKDYWKIKNKQIKASVSASFLIPALVNIFSYWVMRQVGNCQCVTITSQVLNQDMNKTNHYDYYQTNEIILKEWVVTSI